MDAATLYLIAICHGFTANSAPCGAPFFDAHNRSPTKFQRTRENCLKAARRVEAKFPDYDLYCVGSDGTVLNASGEVMDKAAYYEALANWHAAQVRGPEAAPKN